MSLYGHLPSQRKRQLAFFFGPEMRKYFFSPWPFAEEMRHILVDHHVWDPRWGSKLDLVDALLDMGSMPAHMWLTIYTGRPHAGR